MNRLVKLVILFLLLGTVSVEARLWYDSDTTDSYQWNWRIPIVLNETVGLERVNEPVILKLNGLNFSSIRLVDPQELPDEKNEVGGNDIPYQIDGNELLFLGNVGKNTVKVYYLYLSDDPDISVREYFKTDLDLSFTRGGIRIENKKAVWEISSNSYHLGVNRYENKEYGSGIVVPPGLDYEYQVRSKDKRDPFTAYAKNWDCSVLDEGPLRLRINCSANSTTYSVERVYSFFSENAFFEVEEGLEKLDKWEKDVRLEIHNRLRPYFNHTGRYKFQIHEEGIDDNKTFYMAARDTDNGTGRYVFWILGRGNFGSISLRDHSNYDSFEYALYLLNGNVTGRVRYLFRKGGILDARLEYERFIIPLVTVRSMESNSLEIQTIESYDRVYDRDKFIAVHAKSNQVYGTKKVSCRIRGTEFLLYDDGTHGDGYELDNIWTNNESLQVTGKIPTGEYEIYCEATDNKKNTISDSEKFLIFDRGLYHRIDFKTEKLRTRPGGTGRLFINATNPGHFDEVDVSAAVKNLPDGWGLDPPEKFDLKRNERKRIFLELEVPGTQIVGEIPLLIGVKSKDTTEIVKEGIVEIDLYEIEIDTDIDESRIMIKLRDEHENPLDNADTQVTYNNKGELLHTDENGDLYVELGDKEDIEIETKKTGYIPLSAKIGFREREVNYWFPIAALLIIVLTLLIYWNYRKGSGKSSIDNAIVIALVLGIFITLIWVGLTMRGKEPFTALYFVDGSYSNYLDGNSTKFRYVVDCWEHEPTKYELDIFLRNRLAEVDEFWLGKGGEIQIMKLEREKIIEVPDDLALPAKVRLILRAKDKTYDIHYFLRGRVTVNETEKNLTCKNGILDPDETDIDCGGSCVPCDDGKRCDSNLDCLNGFCFKRTCKKPTCSDGIKNQGENDIDCGGQCRPCHCFNEILDPDETDIDCGGSCVPCENEMNCSIDSDCLTGFCYNGACKVPTCGDGIRNQGETGIDCGGPCKPCPSCSDGIRNQGEIDIDCGGPCPECDSLYENRTHVSWIEQVDGFISSVVIREDSRYIAAGSNSYRGNLYIFDNDSELVGEAKTRDVITDIRFTADEKFISPYPMSDVYLFNMKGINRASGFLDKAAKMAFICNISRGSEVFFRLNRTEARWSYWIPWDIRRIEFTPGCVYRVDGYGEIYNISNIQLFENDSLKWGYSVDGDVYSVAVSDNAGYIVVGAGGRRIEEGNYIYLFNKKKRLLWNYRVDWNIYGLAISKEGEFILAGSRSGRVYLLDRGGNLLWQYDACSSILDLDMTSNGNYAVFGTATGGVYFITNPLFNCSDRIQNQRETDVDCGGPCPPCEDGRKCLEDSDCLTGFCYKGICTVPTCDDGIKNQGERGIDCGGPCLPCRPICHRDSDCGKDFVSEPYCYVNYVLRDYVTYSCVNPDTVNSYCETFNETRVEEHCLEDLECREGRCVGRG